VDWLAACNVDSRHPEEDIRSPAIDAVPRWVPRRAVGLVLPCSMGGSLGLVSEPWLRISGWTSDGERIEIMVCDEASVSAGSCKV
jgi:hypothetical protein